MLKVKKSIAYWKRRKLTPIGRLTVVKSILLPLFTHLFISLPNPPLTYVKSLNDFFSEFVWNGKPKIKSTVFIKEYNEGGINMIDIASYMYTLKIKWLRNYVMCSDSKCFKMMCKLFDVDKMFNCGKMFIGNIC